MRILYITNLPSPYVVDYLNELGKLCQLTAVFECSKSTERDKSWQDYKFNHFEGHILNGIRCGVDKAISPGIIKYLRKNVYDGIIVANMCTPTGILATTYMKMRGIPFVLESEGGMAKDGKGIKERIKKFVLSGASLYFSTGYVGDEYFVAYGAPQDRIAHFPFTTLYNDEILKQPLHEKEREAIKNELGCKSDFIILTIGQFIYRKGMDIIMKACKDLSFPCNVYFVGGEPTEEYKRLQNEYGLNNLHFIPFADKETIKKYYKAADVFVLATREDTWGLVIPEAMSSGVPVISTDACVAALCLVKNGENGFVIPSEDSDALKARLSELQSDPALRQYMMKNNLEKMQGYSLETMAQRQIEEIGRLHC